MAHERRTGANPVSVVAGGIGSGGYKQVESGGDRRSCWRKVNLMAFNAIVVLRNAGYPVDMLSEAQRAVFADLNEEEVNVLVSVQQRLHEVGADVEGQDMKLL